MAIDLSIFKGEIPRISDKLLPEGYASSAINCNLQEGNLQPIKGVTSIQDVSADAQTIFEMDGEFLQWDTKVSVVNSLVADSGDRILLTGDSYPKETNAALALSSAPYPTATRRMGIPAPTNALTVTLNGTAGEDVDREGSYVYTIVAKWADGSEEVSGYSAATGVFSVYDDITPRLTGFTDATATGVYTTHFRIYRLNEGTSSTEYQYVGEIAKTETYFDDDVTDDDLGEVLLSVQLNAPDSDLDGLIATSNGLTIGFKGNTVYPSETFKTYAYPSEYSMTVESDIIGLGYTGSLVTVLTGTVPYMLVGQNPESLSLTRLGYQQKCVSARSIVNVQGGVVYASPDGLFQIDETGTGLLITRDRFTKKQWKALSPANLFAFYYDDAYYGFFSGTTDGFRLDLITGEYQPLTLLQNVYGGYYSPDDDLLYLIQTKDAVREIVSFETGSYVDVTYISRLYISPHREIYTAGYVQGDFTNGNATLSFYVDGSSVSTKTVSADGIFRVNLAGDSFQIKISGKATVDRVILGGSVLEVAESV